MSEMNDSIDIKIWSNVEGLSLIDDIRPRRINKFLPDWWKNFPNAEDENIGNIKACPSFSDIFSNGFVLPAWCDTLFEKHGDRTWSWTTPSNSFQWQFHKHEQFVNHSPFWIHEKSEIVWKAINPWSARTPPGYSLYQMPLFYEFNEKFTALPGIIDTDVYHNLNIPLLFHPKKELTEVFIKRGEPLALYFPFKREKFNIAVEEADEKDKIDYKKSLYIAVSKFSKGYSEVRKNIGNNDTY